MTKPNLFIVGAPKCGTTAWASYLQPHPGVFFSHRKEPHYFSEDFPRFRWARSEEIYLGLFENAADFPVRGEASIMYLYSQAAAERIAAFNGQAKVLIFLRGQETFLPSYHHQLLYNHDETDADFARVWALSGARADIPPGCREPKFLDYKAVGAFEGQVARYLETFGPDRVRVLRFEDWIGDPRPAYRAVLDFLGLPDDGRTEFAAVNTAKHHRFAALSSLTQRPPGWALAAARAVRRLTGRSRLGLAAGLRALNTDEGYATAIGEVLKAEIAAHYAEENARLYARLREAGVLITG